MGEYSYIQSDCRLQSTKIGKYCSIADNVRTGFGSHPTNMVTTFPSFYYNTSPELGYTFYGGPPKVELLKKCGGGNFLVEIGNDVWIGSHVLILDGIKIGDGSIIAAGAVVTKDVEPYAIYGGVPAHLIRYRLPKEEISELLKISWWNKDIDWIEKNIDVFSDVGSFIKINLDR